MLFKPKKKEQEKKKKSRFPDVGMWNQTTFLVLSLLGCCFHKFPQLKLSSFWGLHPRTHGSYTNIPLFEILLEVQGRSMSSNS